MADQIQAYPARNVFGSELQLCSQDPVTGFFRDGCCNSCREDVGSHTVCCMMTAEFLEYSRFKGNDLSTPRPEFDFKGLKAGDYWCLCAGRWLEAFQDGMAPKVNLLSTHESCLELISLEELKSVALDLH